MQHTIDSLIENLQAQKAAGVAGNTPVGIPTRDNNGQHGFASLDLVPRIGALAKQEHAKGWTLCKLVSRGGVPVLLL